MPLIAEDPTRVPDHILSGPDLPLTRRSVHGSLASAELENCLGNRKPTRNGFSKTRDAEGSLKNQAGFATWSFCDRVMFTPAPRRNRNWASGE